MPNFITISDIKNELGEAAIDDSNTGLIEQVIGSVEGLWDSLTGKNWYAATYSEIIDYPSRTISQMADHNSVYEIYLNNYPVASLIDIWNDPDRNFTDTAYRYSATYTTCASAKGIVFLEHETAPAIGVQNIRIRYVAGYYSEASGIIPALPLDIRGGIVRQSAYWFKLSKEGRWDIISKAQPQGGSTGYRELEGALLPEFQLLVARYRKYNV